MEKLIDDLLSYSRVGKSAPNKQMVNLMQMAQVITNEIMQGYPQLNTQFKFGEACNVYCDKVLLRQVLQNLLGNAIKYSSKAENPKVEFNWQAGDNEMVFFVKDNGAGFSMEHASKLFTVFQRLHTDSEFEGSGVGLAIVERIIQKHAGRVWAEGEMNNGAAFYFTVPV